MKKIVIMMLVGITVLASCSTNESELSPIEGINKGNVTITPSLRKDKNGPNDDEELILQINGVEVVYASNPRAGELVKLFKGAHMIDSTYTDAYGQFNFDITADVYHIEIDPVDLPLHVTDTFSVNENVDISIELTN